MATHGVMTAFSATVIAVTDSTASNTNTPRYSSAIATAAVMMVVCVRLSRGARPSRSRPLAYTHSTPWLSPPSSEMTTIGSTYHAGEAATRSSRYESGGLADVSHGNAP